MHDNLGRRAGIERQQLAENLFVGDVRGPTVRRRHGSVQDRACASANHCGRALL